MKISVIIPTLNSQVILAKCLESVFQNFDQPQVIVVDGGSEDQTIAIAKRFSTHLLQTQRGRGYQMHAGVQAADNDILLFLHSDTVLPQHAAKEINTFFADQDSQIATFRLGFEEHNVLLDFYSWMTRFDSLWTRFGDQGIVVRKDFYFSLGGFPQWPLFEDVHFLRLARRKAKVYSLPLMVTTSAERFTRNGMVRQQWFNFILINRYLLGQSPRRLALRYERFQRRAAAKESGNF